MKRPTFIFAVALLRRVIVIVCIAVAVGAVALDVRSHFAVNTVYWNYVYHVRSQTSGTIEGRLFAENGIIEFWTHSSALMTAEPDEKVRAGVLESKRTDDEVIFGDYPPRADWSGDWEGFHGFCWYHVTTPIPPDPNAGLVSGTDQQWTIDLPLWFISLLAALPPASAATKLLRGRRRQHSSLCVSCGYDLRATPDRCPECATQVAPPQRQLSERRAGLDLRET